MLIDMLQSGGSAKRRPAVLLCSFQPYGDWLVCGISSQLKQQVTGFDLLVDPSDTMYAATGLKAPSIVRLGFLNTVDSSLIAGSIGALPSADLRLLLHRLASHLAPVP